MYEDLKLYIDGKFIIGSSGVNESVLNPSTNTILANVPFAKQHEMDVAIQSAQNGFIKWRRMSAFERSEIMHKAADLLRTRCDDISKSLTLEQGKINIEAKHEVMVSADVIDVLAEEGKRAYGRIIPPRVSGVRQMVLPEPLGIVAGFSPWNFPVSQAARKIGAALAAGCVIIIKCPEETPGSPVALVRCFHEAGIPSGVINLIYGVASELSEYLIPHPLIRKVSFTGSVPVGRRLASIAGIHMKRTTMELGGHSPMLIFDDIDVEYVAILTSNLKWRNAGQACISPTRFFVHEKIFDKFVAKFVDIAQGIRVGDGLDPNSQMGPLANARRVDFIESIIHDAVEKGAIIASGGKRIETRGNYFEPTVLVNVSQKARIMCEEPFGPIAVILSFNDTDDVIDRANRSPYGLASYVFTHDTRRIEKIVDALECGMISINHQGIGIPETPFGGIKDSGYGHEQTIEGLQAYLSYKFVSGMS
ncbi:MAG: Alpha-ketoglutaric semialdehyde dehydrogenase 1 [Hyphomicrobiaceae bacterium hypho_1]